ncbi:MAG: proteasome endopeptidase complex, archaeal, alpha subunit [Thermoprotei archaeon ex4572_64]|nr:MAG: proteasome endopeptidase complex, archaeal, alpha subunit [Thermoprotei archaeon ex4572_64]
MYTPMIYGYDRAITIFSPEGELYQVRYAGEAVKRGWATLGLKCAGGVVLAAEKRKLGPLIDLNSIEKIYMIDEHVGITPSGLLADARVLIEYARQEAQIHRLIYDEPIDVELLTRRISDLKQIYTQHGGVRPFGAALIIGGVDRHGPKLFQTDPGGIYFGYYATAIGSGASTIMDFLEKNYRYDIALEEGIKLALKALSLVIEALEPDRVEIAAIDSKTRRYRKLSPDEVKLIIDEIRRERT